MQFQCESFDLKTLAKKHGRHLGFCLQAAYLTSASCRNEDHIRDNGATYEGAFSFFNVRMSKNNEKGAQFEKTSYEVIRSLHNDRQVYSNVQIKGRLSKISRQVDIQVVNPEGFDFLIFECKNYGRPLDVAVVEKLATNIVDIGAKKGALVSNSGFSQGAINMAGALGIDVLNLVDSGNPDIRTQIYIPTLVIDTRVSGYRVGLGGTFHEPVSFSENPKELLFKHPSGEIFSAHGIFAHLWNQQETPLSREPGAYKYSLTPPPVEILGREGKSFPLKNLDFIYDVEKKHFLGETRIIEAKGLYNVRERTFQTREIITERIEPHVVEREWKQISQQDANKTATPIGFETISLFGDENGDVQ